MNNKTKHPAYLPDTELFPANASWLASLIGVVLLAFSLPILAMLTY